MSEKLNFRIQILATFRNFSNDSKELKKPDENFLDKQNSELEQMKKELFPTKRIVYWNEKSAVRKVKKQNSGFRAVKNKVDFLKYLFNLCEFPRNIPELQLYLKKKWYRNKLLEQKFLPERRAVLKSDLAAAHFITSRGGSVKFIEYSEWFGHNCPKKELPFTYMPGFHIQCINANNIHLLREGLKNLENLSYLKSISFKGSPFFDDWCLDWLTKEYYAQLEELDISECKKITHRGLSCFYRFECLKKLTMKNMVESPELKVSCLMLLDLMPDLEIEGMNLNIPPKIDITTTFKTLPQTESKIAEVKNSK